MRAWILALILLPGTLAPLELNEGSAWILYGDDAEAAYATSTAHGLDALWLPNLQMAIVDLDRESVARLIERYAISATPDWNETLHLDQSVSYIEADVVRDSVGINRNGPTVLVVDTGVSSVHPDFLAGNLVANVRPEFSGDVIDLVLSSVPIVDTAGHGTHVAGIVAGSGEALGNLDPRHGQYEGVYSNGAVASFQATNPLEPDVASGQAALAAFEWALENQDTHDIRVVTNSWGSSGGFEPDGPIGRATKQLYLAGMTVVFSAGNEGAEGALNRHCQVPWALCVAAGLLSGDLASYSSRGNPNDAWAHPDLTAPGNAIRAAAPLEEPTGWLSTVGSAGEPLYTDRSGTSMAAPHVAGVAGLMQAINPNLSPDQVMDILVATSRPMAGELHEVGAGYLSAAAAATLASQTPGTRVDFLSGTAVKYAGAQSGDPTLSYDPTSSNLSERGTVLMANDATPWWLTETAMFAFVGGAGVLVLALLIAVLIIARR